MISSFQLLEPKLWSHPKLSSFFFPHIQLISKSCWLYLQNIFKIQPPFTIVTANNMDQSTIITYWMTRPPN